MNPYIRPLYTVNGAIDASGFSRSYLFRKMKSGELPYYRHGLTRMIKGEDLIKLIDALPKGEPIEAEGQAIADRLDKGRKTARAAAAGGA